MRLISVIDTYTMHSDLTVYEAVWREARTGLQQPAAQATRTYQNLVATSLFGGEGAMGPSMLCARGPSLVQDHVTSDYHQMDRRKGIPNSKEKTFMPAI